MPWAMVAIGGALGAVSRYALDRVVVSIVGVPTVLGIFLINISGSFLLGMFVSISDSHPGWPTGVRMLVAVGFLGSYTTFSTLMIAGIQSGETGDIAKAALNVAGSVALGLLAATVGIVAGRAL